MVRPPTQRDVADRAAVSTATVSYVLYGRRDRAYPVKPDTRERVLRAARELGYQPNHAARSLRRHRTNVVCVVHRHPADPWTEHLIAQFHTGATQRGYSLITLPVGQDDDFRDALWMLHHRYADGAIIAPDYPFSPTELTDLARRGMALVVFDDDIAPEGFDVVRQHRRRACVRAVEQLVELGHRDIAYLGHTDGDRVPQEADKLAAFRAAMRAAGLNADAIITGAESREAAYLAAPALVDRRPRPTAVVCGSDRAALALIVGLRQLGVEIPGHLSVVGIGNLAEGAIVAPRLTTVGIPDLDFTPAVERFFSRLTTDQPRACELHQPWSVIVRDSTSAPAATPDPSRSLP